MDNLFKAFRLAAIALGSVIAGTFIILSATTLWMPGTFAHQMARYQSMVVALFAVPVLAVVAFLLVYAAWMQADTERDIRPLSDNDRTHYIVELPSRRKVAILDIRDGTIKEVGLERGRRSQALDEERVIDSSPIPTPQEEHDDELVRLFFSR